MLVSLLFLFWGTFVIINSCTHAYYVMPDNLRKGDPTICFERDILPIFISNCTQSNCHNAVAHKGGYTLDNYSNIMKKGIVPGNIAASKIWESVAMNTWDVENMPIDAPGLNNTQLDLLRRWIQSGAIDSGSDCSNTICDTNLITYAAGIAPIVQTYCTGCHNSASAPGGSLIGYNNVQNAAVNGKLIGDISQQSGYHQMPPGITLSACQVTQVKKWVSAGALNN